MCLLFPCLRKDFFFCSIPTTELIDYVSKTGYIISVYAVLFVCLFTILGYGLGAQIDFFTKFKLAKTFCSKKKKFNPNLVWIRLLCSIINILFLGLSFGWPVVRKLTTGMIADVSFLLIRCVALISCSLKAFPLPEIIENKTNSQNGSRVMKMLKSTKTHVSMFQKLALGWGKYVKWRNTLGILNHKDFQDWIMKKF